MAFATAPTLLKVVLILALIGFVVEVIGFATPYWVSYSGYDYRRYQYSSHAGLWKACTEGHDHYRGYTAERCGKAAGPGMCHFVCHFFLVYFFHFYKTLNEDLGGL